MAGINLLNQIKDGKNKPLDENFDPTKHFTLAAMGIDNDGNKYYGLVNELLSVVRSLTFRNSTRQFTQTTVSLSNVYSLDETEDNIDKLANVDIPPILYFQPTNTNDLSDVKINIRLKETAVGVDSLVPVYSTETIDIKKLNTDGSLINFNIGELDINQIYELKYNGTLYILNNESTGYTDDNVMSSYNASATYSITQKVFNDDGIFESRTNGNQNNPLPVFPVTQNTNWTLLASWTQLNNFANGHFDQDLSLNGAVDFQNAIPTILTTLATNLNQVLSKYSADYYYALKSGTLDQFPDSQIGGPNYYAFSGIDLVGQTKILARCYENRAFINAFNSFSEGVELVNPRRSYFPGLDIVDGDHIVDKNFVETKVNRLQKLRVDADLSVDLDNVIPYILPLNSTNYSDIASSAAEGTIFTFLSSALYKFTVSLKLNLQNSNRGVKFAMYLNNNEFLDSVSTFSLGDTTSDEILTLNVSFASVFTAGSTFQFQLRNFKSTPNPSIIYNGSQILIEKLQNY